MTSASPWLSVIYLLVASVFSGGTSEALILENLANRALSEVSLKATDAPSPASSELLAISFRRNYYELTRQISAELIVEIVGDCALDSTLVQFQRFSQREFTGLERRILRMMQATTPYPQVDQAGEPGAPILNGVIIAQAVIKAEETGAVESLAEIANDETKSIATRLLLFISGEDDLIESIWDVGSGRDAHDYFLRAHSRYITRRIERGWRCEGATEVFLEVTDEQVLTHLVRGIKFGPTISRSEIDNLDLHDIAELMQLPEVVLVEQGRFQVLLDRAESACLSQLRESVEDGAISIEDAVLRSTFLAVYGHQLAGRNAR